MVYETFIRYNGHIIFFFMSNEGEFQKNDFRRKGSLIWNGSDLKNVDEVINEAKIICKAYKRAIFIKHVVSKGSIKEAALFVRGSSKYWF